MRASLQGLNESKLRLWLALFFLALAIPTAFLIRYAYGQLKWETFHIHRLLAEELATRIDRRAMQWVEEEETRSFADYSFLIVAGDPKANFLQRSALSAYPVRSPIPGLIGHFQVDTDGGFASPLLPGADADASAYGISTEDFEQRVALAQRIEAVLSENRLVDARVTTPQPGAGRVNDALDAPSAASDSEAESAAAMTVETASVAEMAAGQAAFDELNELSARERKDEQGVFSTLGRVEDLALDDRYRVKPSSEAESQVPVAGAQAPQRRSARKERGALPESQARRLEQASAEQRERSADVRIRAFESEIDPFEFSLLDSGHFVLFRKVWRDGQRLVQGALIEQAPFLEGLAEAAFRETALSQMSDLIIAYHGEVMTAFTGQASGRLYRSEELRGAFLYDTRLSAPLANLKLLFSVTRLPAGAGGTIIGWLAAILAMVLCGGFYLLYRLGVKQIALSRQQQDFVSAVSHELKTPLTSIRMYGEILREGWASEEKKRTYYDYIFDESERLSRLIANVLQLARMTRNALPMDLQRIAAAELMDGIRSKVGSQVERAGFELRMHCEDDAGRATVCVDRDYFTQIVINLVDNAIKFSQKADVKAVDIRCRALPKRTVAFSVRDYGPGVPKDQARNIFKLFFRPEGGLSRETAGTGIGLALVRQLTLTMNGEVDVTNAHPGAEFTISFPRGPESAPPDPQPS